MATVLVTNEDCSTEDSHKMQQQESNAPTMPQVIILEPILRRIADDDDSFPEIKSLEASHLPILGNPWDPPMCLDEEEEQRDSEIVELENAKISSVSFSEKNEPLGGLSSDDEVEETKNDVTRAPRPAILTLLNRSVKNSQSGPGNEKMSSGFEREPEQLLTDTTANLHMTPERASFDDDNHLTNESNTLKVLNLTKRLTPKQAQYSLSNVQKLSSPDKWKLDSATATAPQKVSSEENFRRSNNLTMPGQQEISQVRANHAGGIYVSKTQVTSRHDAKAHNYATRYREKSAEEENSSPGINFCPECQSKFESNNAMVTYWICAHVICMRCWYKSELDCNQCTTENAINANQIENVVFS